MSSTKLTKIVATLGPASDSEETISKITAPIGLQINSHTPFEIAVSILAQLISIKNAV